MISEKDLVLYLLVFIGIREIVYWYQLNVMVNKVMSRSFYDYKLAKAVTPEPKRVARTLMDDGLDEDFNALTGIG